MCSAFPHVLSPWEFLACLQVSAGFAWGDQQRSEHLPKVNPVHCKWESWGCHSLKWSFPPLPPSAPKAPARGLFIPSACFHCLSMYCSCYCPSCAHTVTFNGVFVRAKMHLYQSFSFLCSTSEPCSSKLLVMILKKFSFVVFISLITGRK